MAHFSECSTVAANCNTATQIEMRDRTAELFPGEALVLHEDEDGRDLVGEHVGVGRGRQPLAGQRHDVQPGRELVEEIRVS